MIRVVAALAVVIALTACGQTGCVCAALRVVQSPHLDPGFDVLVTDHDRAVSARVGQKIEVYLMQPQKLMPWEKLTADDLSVLQPVNIGIVPPRADATVAGFVALKAGVANITAYALPGKCATNEACPMYAMSFQARVTVT